MQRGVYTVNNDVSDSGPLVVGCSKEIGPNREGAGTLEEGIDS